MLITREDIQRVGDEETLLHFLEEKLNLPVPESLPLEDITTKFANFALGLSGAVANQVLDCQELSVSPGKSSGIVLIRFNSRLVYTEALRAVAEGLDRLGRNPVDLCFICMNEYFQPFAIANFNDSESEDWQTAILNIRAWTQENTHIHTSSEHELPIGFFTNEPSGDNEDNKDDPLINKGIDEEIADNDIFANADSRDKPPVNEPSEISNNKTARHRINPISSNNLLSKLEDIGTPLERHKDITIYIGLDTTHKEAFVVDEHTCRHLIAKDSDSAKLIESFPESSRIPRKWRWELSNIIYLKSSSNKQWPWSGKDELEAERIFKDIYPAISEHMHKYKNILKRSVKPAKYYWEIPARNMLQKLEHPKIIYPATGRFMPAAYDIDYRFLLSSSYFIPTTDLSLLAILNSKLFGWYTHKKYQYPNKRLSFVKKNMQNAPIVPRTEEQKSELSDLVQQILDVPNNPEVPHIEREIDQLVYKLYDLTPAETALIEEEITHDSLSYRWDGQ